MVVSRRLRQFCFWVVLAVLAAPAAPAAHAQAAAEPWDRLELPGAAADLASVVGIDPATPRARLLLEVIRAVHAAPVGQCRECDRGRERLAAWLSNPHGRPIESTQTSDDASRGTDPTRASGAERVLPSPIPVAAWHRLLRVDRAASLAVVLLQDRRASLLYYGLMGLDAPTRRYLAQRPDLLEDLYKDHSAAFAVFGRSFRVSGGAVVVPGAPATRMIWEELVGESVTDPEAFIHAALQRSAGRLAFFLDTVAHLDDSRRAAALVATEPDPDTRLARVRTVARFFTDLQPEWRVADRPFARPLLDASLVLLSLAFTADGRLARPDNSRFWNAVFHGNLPDAADTTGWRETIMPPTPADCAWLLEQTLTADVPTGRERVAAISFVQRLFGSAPEAQWPAVARVARAFIDARSAMVALERLGVTEIAVFDRLAGQVARFSREGERAAASLTQFQSVVAALDRLRARDVITRQQATTLVDSLVGVPLLEDGQYRGGVSRWIDAQLLPALPTVETDDPEARLISALAGRTAPARGASGSNALAPDKVTWEGVSYEVDVARAESVRLQRVRARQLGNRLDGAMTLARAVAAVADAPGIAAARRACAHVDYAAGSLRPVSWPGPGLGAALAKPGELVDEPCREIRDIAADADLRSEGVRRTIDRLWQVSDAVLADALAALAYALHVGDPAGAIDLAPDIARRHSFGFQERGLTRQAAGPWALPEERAGTGTPWHVTGSLLGLEHALAKLSLRFLFGQEMPSAPRLNESDRRTLALGLSLLSPAALADADRDRIVAALAAGRTRLVAEGTLAHELDHVAQVAGWSEWRCETIRWAVAEDPESLPELLTLSDYFWMGLPEHASDHLDAWGAATTPVDGDLRLAWPPARPWEELAGRGASGQLLTRFIDLNLRIAEALAQYHLPARLAAGTLAPALADLIHEAPLGHADDWYALAGYVARLPEDRLLDYIATLTAGGPLVPVDEARTSPGL